MNESEIPINSFDEPDSHFEQTLQNIPKAFNNVKKSNFASKRIILLSNKRKGSILKRPKADNMNFQRKDVRHSVLAITKGEKNFVKKDTIEKLKQASFEIPKSFERDTHSDTQNYSIEFLEPDEDYLDMSKIPELLHTKKDLKKLTFTDTGQTKGNYSFYAIKELDDEPNSADRELSEEKKSHKENNLSPQNNDFKWFAVSKFFNDSDNDSRSSLGYDPEKEQQEKKSDKKSPGKMSRNADKKRENKERDYQYFQDFLHSTINPTQEEIGNSIEENPNLKKEVSDIPNLFRQQTKILHKRKPDFLKVIEMDEIEKLKYDFEHKTDRYPLKGIRKFILLFFR